MVVVEGEGFAIKADGMVAMQAANSGAKTSQLLFNVIIMLLLANRSYTNIHMYHVDFSNAALNNSLVLAAKYLTSLSGSFSIRVKIGTICP